MIRARLIGPWLIAIALGTSLAHAGSEAEKRAAESFRQAQAAFNRREYAAAAAAFEKAAELDPHPAPLVNAAQAWELAHDYVRAAEDCDRVLGLPSVAEPFAQAARDELGRVGGSVGTLDLVGPRTFAAHVDDGPEVRLPARRRVTPGHHDVHVTDLASNATRSVDVTIAAGESRTLDVTPPAETRVEAAAPAPVTPPRAPVAEPAAPANGLRTGMWVAIGGAAAAAVTTTVFGVFTLNAKDDYGATPTKKTQSAFYRNRLVTNVAITVAGALAVTGVILWRASRKPQAASVAAAAAFDGGRLEATVHF
jgi:hypothetical protein